MRPLADKLIQDATLHGKVSVFRDRDAAGQALARLLAPLSLEAPLLLAIPAGGVPVAAAVQRSLGWPLELAVVSKITLPWNSEAGYGAVAFDGSVLLNERLLAAVALSQTEVEEGIERTRRKVERRVQRLSKGGRVPELSGKTAVLVDDGLASGFTMSAAVRACSAASAQALVVATPTGHANAIERLLPEVDLVVCANVRAGTSFAVAEAYERWHDVPEVEVELILERLQSSGADANASSPRAP